MRALTLFLIASSLTACGDFVDGDGNTSFREVARGMQSLGDRVAEMGEALARDADVASVPWTDLAEVLPGEVDGAELLRTEGDDAVDRNGAGLSVAHAHYLARGDSVFVGVVDLGALRSGAQLALRWAAPLVADRDVEGDVEETTVDGHPAIRIRDEDDDGALVALLVRGRFVVVAGAGERGHEAWVRRALEKVDYSRLEDWAEYGSG
jgi:hypothetical protein